MYKFYEYRDYSIMFSPDQNNLCFIYFSRPKPSVTRHSTYPSKKLHLARFYFAAF